MIASPSDVQEERRIAQEVIADWNAVHAEDRRVVLLPLSWERDSTPLQGDRPQALINAQVLKKADVLVAIFWTRIGSSTGVAPSGTVEELREHIAAQKPTLLYFSSKPAAPDTLDPAQITALKDFKKEVQSKGLYSVFESPESFRRQFSHHLAKLVVDHPSFRTEKLRAPTEIAEPARKQLSAEASRLLTEAAKDAGGVVLVVPSLYGGVVQTNGKNFVTNRDARNFAEWRGAVEELVTLAYLLPKGHEGRVFTVTRDGYKAADEMNKNGPV